MMVVSVVVRGGTTAMVVVSANQVVRVRSAWILQHFADLVNATEADDDQSTHWRREPANL